MCQEESARLLFIYLILFAKKKNWNEEVERIAHSLDLRREGGLNLHIYVYINQRENRPGRLVVIVSETDDKRSVTIG